MCNFVVLANVWECIDRNRDTLATLELLLSIAASAFTIIGVLFAIILFVVVWLKKRRVSAFLKHCDTISEIVSEILKVYNNNVKNPEATYDRVGKDVKVIIDERTGVACLNKFFVTKKINKIVGVGHSVNEIMELEKTFKTEIEGKEQKIEQLRADRNNSTDEDKYETPLKELYEDYNKFVADELTEMNDRIRRIYNSIAIMFHSRV